MSEQQTRRLCAEGIEMNSTIEINGVSYTRTDTIKENHVQAAADTNETQSEVHALEIGRLNADLAHTEECCVGWATDFGNTIKELDTLRRQYANLKKSYEAVIEQRNNMMVETGLLKLKTGDFE